MKKKTGSRNSLGTIGVIVGIVVAFLVIRQLFFSEAKPVATFVGGLWDLIFPSYGDSFLLFHYAVKEYARSNILHPYWTALIALILGGTIKNTVESQIYNYNINIIGILMWCLPGIVWLYIFWGIVSNSSAILFIAGYLLITMMIDLWLEKNR